ncbi:MAG: c-type cytochrome [Bryobacteraceae bacterium]
MNTRLWHSRWRRVNVGLWIALGLAAVDPASRGDDAGILNGAFLETNDGKQIYEAICQGCHMNAAQGAIGAGHYPALAKDSTLASRQYMALTLLMGRRNMPAFGAKHAIGFGGPPATLTEEQIAAVINYVRSHFGNHYTDTITAAEVRSLDQDAH